MMGKKNQQKPKRSLTKKICRLSPMYRLVDNEVERHRQKKEQKQNMKKVRQCKRHP